MSIIKIDKDFIPNGSNDGLRNHLFVKQKLVDKFLGIEGDKDER